MASKSELEPKLYKDGEVRFIKCGVRDDKMEAVRYLVV